MAQAHPRRQVGLPPADVIPLTPTPSDQRSSQWPTFELTPAQRGVIRASSAPHGAQAPWLLTTPLTAPTAAEVTLPEVPLSPAATDATGTLTGGARAALVGAAAPSRSIRTSGPQAGPAARVGAGGAAVPARAATPTGRLAALQTGALVGGGRVAPAQQAPQRAVGQPPAHTGPAGVGPRQGGANRAPIWSPMPTGQGMAPSLPDVIGQRLAWVAISLSMLAALICWLSILLATLGLFPLALAVAGVICGSIAQRRTLRRSSERRLAVTGITLGYLGAIASLGLLVFVVTHGGG